MNIYATRTESLESTCTYISHIDSLYIQVNKDATSKMLNFIALSCAMLIIELSGTLMRMCME